MPNYTFRCRSGHEQDVIRPVGTESVVCRECAHVATRVSVYRQAQVERQRKVYARDFIEASDMLASQEEEYEKREGVPPPQISLVDIALKRARRLKAQGAPDSRSIW